MLHLTAWAISKFEHGACKRGIMTVSVDTDCQTSNRIVGLKRLQGISRVLCYNWDLVSKLAKSIAPAAICVASEGPQGSTYVCTHGWHVHIRSHAWVVGTHTLARIRVTESHMHNLNVYMCRLYVWSLV